MSIAVRWSFGALLVVMSVVTLAHDGHVNDAPWRACDDLRVDDPCAFENATRYVYRGTCRSMSDELMCVRNQPIEKFVPDTGKEHTDARSLLRPKAG